MPSLTVNLRKTRWLSGTLVLASLVFATAILYWSREILIPIALAILLTFILAPVSNMFRRCGLGRAPSAIVTVVLAFALFAGMGAMLVLQFRGLAGELPNYQQNLRDKVSDLRLASKGGSIEKVEQTVNAVVDEINQGRNTTTTNSGAIPVVVTATASSDRSIGLLAPLVEPLASAALVLVLVIFMMLRREDLRDRLLRLIGYGRLAATTKTIDEAGKGVSRYLLRQFLMNTGFGTALGVSLFFIGLPYALLWGFLAGVARFVPYVGPWLGAGAPVLMALAVFDGWTTGLLVIGLVAVLEGVTNLILEPVIYGQGIGVSEVALLVMVAFWTWLWGPIGLLLAAPLTVCLLVVSKSVPHLEFLHVLLSSNPALDRHHAFYQRLVARDPDDAQDIADAFLKEHSRAEMFDQLLIPTLIACRHDYKKRRLTAEDRDRVFHAIAQLLPIEENSKRATTQAMGPGIPSGAGSAAGQDKPQRIQILGCPAHDEADALALHMLGELVQSSHCQLQVLSPELLASERLAEMDKTQPTLVYVGCLPGAPVLPIRRFCKRLRASRPDLPIVIGIFGAREFETPEVLSGLTMAVSHTLAEAKNHVLQCGQVTPSSRIRHLAC